VSDRSDNPRPEEPDHGLDVDAAFADIVAHWEPDEASTWPDEAEPGPADEDDGEAVDGSDSGPDGVRRDDETDDGLRRLFTPAWSAEPHQELEPEEADEEEHFEPPPPPPLPALDPHRKAAWTALVGTPVLALVLLVAGVTLPEWMAVGLVLAFVGGFGYLVATMGSSPPDDWSGNDGAVL
jgi:hypothetical protein